MIRSHEDDDLRKDVDGSGRSVFATTIGSSTALLLAALVLSAGVAVHSLVPGDELTRLLAPAIHLRVEAEQLADGVVSKAGHRPGLQPPALLDLGKAVDRIAVAMGAGANWSDMALGALADGWRSLGALAPASVASPAKAKRAHRSHGRPARGPSVDEVSLVGGDLSAETVAEEIRRRQPAVRAVYERALKRNPKLHGKIEVRFRVDSCGKVRDPVVEQDTVQDPPTRRLLLATLSRWRFPAAGRGEQQFLYPFSFQPSW